MMRQKPHLRTGAFNEDGFPLTRREFMGVAAVSTLGLVTGCVTNPVTGRRQLMLMSSDAEINIDRQQSPHQFSADYGAIQDKRLQSYIQDVTTTLAVHTHRPQMPYKGVGLNASYVNGYIFPGGSMGITRGLLAQMEDEATLAALIGHELGHVNARHSAHRMTKGMVTTALLLGVGAAVAVKHEKYTPLVVGLGGIGAGALLAKYSRDDERQADELGMEYMVRGGYAPQGMIALMDILRGLNKRKPNVIEMMFASHPMSDERYATAVARVRDRYESAAGQKLQRDRYRDMTAGIRARSGLLDHIQNGDAAMHQRQWAEAEKAYRSALDLEASDYEALMKLGRNQLAQQRFETALEVIAQARRAYPEEPQSYQVGGVAALQAGLYDRAFQDLDHYGRVLPGNPLTVFLSGRALEGMGRIDDAAERYRTFLSQVTTGDEADYARQRLAEWGSNRPADREAG